MKDAAQALHWCVAEMERRYRLMAALRVRNVDGLNRLVDEAVAAGEPVEDPLWPEEAEEAAPELERLPLIVVVIDELADLMMTFGKKVDQFIARIAQKARAAGIHLVLATQRPSVDVITGLIKANVPARMSYQVSSRIDSRTILDQGGAEQLLGYGDMLFLPPGTSIPIRVHGAFVSGPGGARRRRRLEGARHPRLPGRCPVGPGRGLHGTDLRRSGRGHGAFRRALRRGRGVRRRSPASSMKSTPSTQRSQASIRRDVTSTA